MAKANRSKTAKAGNTPKAVNGSILLSAQVNRLAIVLEQIEGLAEVLRERCDERDAATQSVLNVIAEKASEADSIISSGYGRLPDGVESLMAENAKRRAATRERAATGPRADFD